jgi:hypothetical protein
MTTLEKIIETFPDDEFVKAIGFDEAILGVDEISMRLIYSVTKCIEILMKEMTEEEAIEYFEYNIMGTHVGEKTPIWCVD